MKGKILKCHGVTTQTNSLKSGFLTIDQLTLLSMAIFELKQVHRFNLKIVYSF